jgi:hypothetical protein
MERQGPGGEGTRARQTLQGADGDGDVEGDGIATPPDNARAQSGTGRWITTLSMRQRTRAFFCAPERTPVSLMVGICWPRSASAARSEESSGGRSCLCARACVGGPCPPAEIYELLLVHR